MNETVDYMTQGDPVRRIYIVVEVLDNIRWTGRELNPDFRIDSRES